ncbi:MAG: HAD family hydrolase [Bacteroidota bacterium]
MDQIKLVIFDMAGTTVKDDQVVVNCFYEAANSTGLAATRHRINSMHGLPKKKVIQTLWEEMNGEGHPDNEKNIENTFRAFKEILENHYRTNPVVPTPGTLETFNWLKSEGVKIALNTGFYREVVDIILNKLGWDIGLDENYLGSENSLIDLSVTPSETNGIGRPHPDMIFRAMDLLNIKDPKNVVKIGDTPSDLREGIAAGCLLSLAVTNGSHDKEELELFYNDGLIPSMEKFKGYILQKVNYLQLIN